MKERDRGKSNFRKETDKENQERILKSMTEEERDQYFDELRRKRREKRMKKQKQERRKKLAVLELLLLFPFLYWQVRSEGLQDIL